MQTDIAEAIQQTSEGKEAERILRTCVHCGFCTATCPTYRLLGDDLDSPRGRIYLIKSMLEGKTVTDKTMQHLDRCLTCRACETTCPSGVEYGKLIDIGRHFVEKHSQRSVKENLFRQLLLRTLPYPKRFTVLLKLGQLLRPLLPGTVKTRIPVKQEKVAEDKTQSHPRKVLLLSGCVQPGLAPEINQSVKLLLDHLGFSVIEVENEQCCGALSHHLNAAEQAKVFMQANIDVWWPHIEAGVEAIISTASGCGVHVKEYGYHFREDNDYFEKAQKVSSLTVDIAEFIRDSDPEQLQLEERKQAIAFQSPCTLQHGQKLNGVVEGLLKQLGCSLKPVDDAYLCCGSAGVYSLLQPEISQQLKTNKLDALLQYGPEIILTANIGCLEHLRQSSPVPVMHWVVYLAERFKEGKKSV